MSVDFSLYLYSAEQVKQGEVAAAKLAKISMYKLMERAGAAVFNRMLESHNSLRSMTVLCGGGNNGGDGYVIARLAKEQGVKVRLYHCGDRDKLTGDAKTAMQAWINAGGAIQCTEQLLTVSNRSSSVSSSPISDNELIVDALLGTGLSGSVRPHVSQVIDLINQAKLPVFSVDVPSGLCANTGSVLGNCIKATQTVTFIGCKKGLVTGQARAYVGDLHFAGLKVEALFADETPTSTRLMNENELFHPLPMRSPTAHKGSNGKLVCIGGNEGMAGAILLASTAAARVGAGLVSTLAHPDSVLPLQTYCPEVMTRKWCGDTTFLNQRIDWSSVLLIGPGLGTNDWSMEAYLDVLEVEKPKIFDADALNLLANHPNKDHLRVLTPHSGEAARLLGKSVAEVEANRYQAVVDLYNKYGGVIVLKGPGTLVYDGDSQSTYVCPKGNAGMASGGMGDVLSGVIAGLVAQRMSLIDATKLAVYCHSKAADIVAKENGQRGMLAGDLIPVIRQLLNHSFK